MLKVTPIIAPNIAWESFVKEANASLGRSPTRSLDAKNIRPGNHATFIAACGEFESAGTSPYDLDHERILDLLDFGFLVVSDTPTFFEILKSSDFRMLHADQVRLSEHVFIIVGSLRIWRQSIRKALKKDAADELRMFHTETLKIFDRFGLTRIWEGTRRTLPDNTIILEDKR